MPSQTYETLDKAWQSTCKVLFGSEIGELDGYADWLWELMEPMHVKKSALSGRDVSYSLPDYCRDARFISFDEVDYGKKFEPLNINEIKDIDSIAEALQERFLYVGNIILANSKDVDRSTNIQNSFHIYHSNYIYDSQYVAYSSYNRWSKYIFGVINDVESDFLIRGFDTLKESRCLEIWRCYNSSDVYYSFGVEGSQDALFSFNIENKRHVIGNIELQKEKYKALKAKLVEEIRAELESKKALPSLIELVSGKPIPAIPKKIETDESRGEEDRRPIEEAFRKTTEIVLGRERRDMDRYEKWLMRHIPPLKTAKSAATGKPVYYGTVMSWSELPKVKERLVKEKESKVLGGLLKLGPDEIESLDSIKGSLWKIAFLTPEGTVGENRNIIQVPLVNQSVNCYKGLVYSFNENAAFCFWPRNSKYMLGSALTFSSQFCINAYYSLNLSRAFECDNCSNSSDIYFSHNCENAREAMFCFNAKNLSHAIGSAQMPPDKYKSVKTGLLNQIADEIERTGGLRHDIYNVGCVKG